MDARFWNRRQVIVGGALVAAGATTAGLGRSTGTAAQLPPPEQLQDSRITFVTTTETNAWQNSTLFKPTFRWDMLNLNVDPGTSRTGQTMEGFGGCFNELGWTSLKQLSEQDRESVLHELFDPVAGARFTYCRMPIGANDFATEAYSYDETDGDFDLKHFSIEHDRQTLIPFIHAAQRYQPKLRLWASPWTPPSWMKRNHFYAEAKAYPGMKDNGIRADQIGHEGEDMFIQEPRYFERLREILRALYRCISGRGDSRRHGDAAERVQLCAEFSELHVDPGGLGTISSFSGTGDAEARRRCVLWHAGAGQSEAG